MLSAFLINPAVGHLADLALWEAELAADRQVVMSGPARRLGPTPKVDHPHLATPLCQC